MPTLIAISIPLDSLSQNSLGGGDDVVHREPEVLAQILSGRRGAEAVHPNDCTLHADVPPPAVVDARLDSQASSDGLRQHRLAIRLVLRVEESRARYRHDAHASTLLREGICRIARKRNLRAG